MKKEIRFKNIYENFLPIIPHLLAFQKNKTILSPLFQLLGILLSYTLLIVQFDPPNIAHVSNNATSTW